MSKHIICQTNRERHERIVSKFSLHFSTAGNTLEHAQVHTAPNCLVCQCGQRRQPEAYAPNMLMRCADPTRSLSVHQSEHCFLRAQCGQHLQPPPPIWIANTGKRRVYKIVQNYGIIFIWNSKMVCLHASSPQIWIANTEEGECVQNSSSVVKNCSKCVQNYGTIFILKFENGRATCLQLPKFELRIPGKRRVYKIVQNYGTIFIWNSKMVWLHACSPPNLNCEFQGRGWCTKFELGCAKLYDMCAKLWHHFCFEIQKWYGWGRGPHFLDMFLKISLFFF